MKKARIGMKSKRHLVKWALIVSASIWAADIVYKIVNNISYVNRERCILYRILPGTGFIVFEYLLETLIIVFVGTFVAVWLGRKFLKLRRFLPQNPVTAFVYGSLIPVCSCAAIPLLSSMRGKLRFPTTMSFILAAPLLSPYIIVLSFSVLGPTYAILRIASSFVLVMVTAVILGIAQRDGRMPEMRPVGGACDKQCGVVENDIYVETLVIFRGLLPFLVIAGAIAVALEHMGSRDVLLQGWFGGGAREVLVWIMVGVPLYFCNGAEVLFLRPMMSHGFPVGTGIAFSLTSTAICTTSIAMLLRMMGTRLTVVLVASIIGVCLGLALLLNSVV
jgi:uncharacterized membrane protein YraQ (UPF0718 family)